MELIKDSVVGAFLFSIWTTLAEAWKTSALGDLWRRFLLWIRTQAQTSKVFQFLWRESSLSKSWLGSRTCRGFTMLVNLPCAVCKAAYQAGKQLCNTSVCFRSLSRLGGAISFLIGLFLTILLVVPHHAWNNLYALVLVLVLVALFAIGSAVRPARRFEVREIGPYLTLFLGFICYALLSSLSIKDSLRFFAFHLTSFLLVLLLVSSVRRFEQLQLILALAVAGLTISALYGCYQGVIGVPVIANQQDMLVNADMPGRVYSFFDNPNNFAELLIMLLPFTFALFLNAKSLGGKIAAVFSAVVSLISLGFTLSRSCWIGMVLAVMVWILFINWRILPIFFVAGICCIPLLPDSIYNRILTIGNLNDSSTSYRFAIYEATGVLMRDYWLRGVGLGSDVLKEAFQDYPTMFDGNYPIHTHNNYLQVWAEMGFFGLLAFLGTILYELKTGVKAFFTTGDPRIKRILAAALSGFCGILLVSIPEYTWFYARNMFFYWFVFGVIATCVKLSRPSSRENHV